MLINLQKKRLHLDILECIKTNNLDQLKHLVETHQVDLDKLGEGYNKPLIYALQTTPKTVHGRPAPTNHLNLHPPQHYPIDFFNNHLLPGDGSKKEWASSSSSSSSSFASVIMEWRKERETILHYLLHHTKNFNYEVGPDGETPFFLALRYQYYSMARYLLEGEVGQIQLKERGNNLKNLTNDTENVKEFQEEKRKGQSNPSIKITSKNSYSRAKGLSSPFSSASSSFPLIDINYRNHRGENALLYLFRKKALTPFTLHLLMTKGLNINAVDINGKTALLYTVVEEYDEEEEEEDDPYHHHYYKYNPTHHTLPPSNAKTTPTTTSLSSPNSSTSFLAPSPHYPKEYYLKMMVRYYVFPLPTILKLLMFYRYQTALTDLQLQELVAREYQERFPLIQVPPTTPLNHSEHSNSKENSSSTSPSSTSTSTSTSTPTLTQSTPSTQNPVQSQSQASIASLNVGWNHPFLMACHRYNMEAIRLFLTCHPDLQVRDPFGRTPLMYFAMDGYRSTAKLLLEAGAEVNAQEESGRTPLFMACEHHQPRTAELFLYYGADPTLSAHLRRQPPSVLPDHPTFSLTLSVTPLQIAVERGYWKIVEILLKHQVSPNEPITILNNPNLYSMNGTLSNNTNTINNNNMNHGSSSNNHTHPTNNTNYSFPDNSNLTNTNDSSSVHSNSPNATTSFPDPSNSIKVNTTNNSIITTTPLILACRQSDVPMVRTLLSYHADPTLRESLTHKTAKEIAEERGFSEGIQLFQEFEEKWKKEKALEEARGRPLTQEEQEQAREQERVQARQREHERYLRQRQKDLEFTRECIQRHQVMIYYIPPESWGLSSTLTTTPMTTTTTTTTTASSSTLASASTATTTSSSSSTPSTLVHPTINIHYKIGDRNRWTPLPGIPMYFKPERSDLDKDTTTTTDPPFSEKSGDHDDDDDDNNDSNNNNYYYIKIPLWASTTIEVCFNDDTSSCAHYLGGLEEEEENKNDSSKPVVHWDSRQGQNYHLHPGCYTIQNGEIREGKPF